MALIFNRFIFSFLNVSGQNLKYIVASYNN